MRLKASPALKGLIMLGSSFCNVCARANVAIFKSVLSKLFGLQLIALVSYLSRFLVVMKITNIISLVWQMYY